MTAEAERLTRIADANRRIDNVGDDGDPPPPRAEGEALRYFLLATALYLLACGSEPPPEPPPVQPAREICTVTLLANGQVVCTCVPAPEAP